MLVREKIPTLTINEKRAQSILKVSEITHLKASSNYTFIHHLSKTILASKTLRYFHDQLCSSSFIRTHQSYSVNVNFIDAVDFSNSLIILSDGVKIPISRSKKRSLKDFFNNKMI